jgi:hypothetical protein
VAGAQDSSLCVSRGWDLCVQTENKISRTMKPKLAHDT